MDYAVIVLIFSIVFYFLKDRKSKITREKFPIRRDHNYEYITKNAGK
mgnify:CR=1 FL=1